MKLYYKNLIILLVLVFLAGCAAQAPYLKLDASLQKDIRPFGSVQYLPLERLCDVYKLDYKWDAFIKTATIEKRSNSIVLRAGSDSILVNGEAEKLDRPVILDGGKVFVPVSFARNNLAPIIGAAPTVRMPEAEISKRFTIRTVVIDPGHGGHDVGAIGRRLKLREKHMALTLDKKIKNILEESGIRVIMTRDSDTFISLSKRAEIANRSGADLFVSVHINASRTKSLKGFECYFLSNATDDNARALEAFENASLKTGDEASIEHSKRLDRTLWDMTLTEDRRESAELAGYICSSVKDNVAIGNRGLRSARFYVLKHTYMPSVLVEGGYISNRYEEMKFKDETFLDGIASAVAKGILTYKKEYERTKGFTRT